MGVRRAAAGLFVVVAIVLLAAVRAPVPAAAAITTPFATRFEVNTNGSILLRGNTNLTCPTLAANCANARNGSGGAVNNNDFAMVYTDADNDLATFNDSTATIDMPAGSAVLFAGLYWGAESNLPLRNQVLFRTPAGASWTPVTASSLFSSGGNYQGFADVTAQVAAAGNGVYGVANIQAAIGLGRYAGWSLVIAYRNPAEDLRSLRIYDGFGSLTSGNLVIPMTGFETPHAGTVHARIGAVAYEGDRGTSGDSFLVDGQPLSDAANLSNNFFNSTVSDAGAHVGGRDPNYPNLTGLDIDQVDATGLFGHGATATTLTLTTTGDAYYPGVITFTIDLYAPRIVTTMTGTDVNGGDLLPGDEIEYRIGVRNEGSDTADDVVLADAVPLHTTYVPGRLTLQGAPLTDATGDDAGWYAAGSTGWNLGSIPYLGTTYVTFRVRVGVGAPAGHTITNLVNVSYTGRTTSVNVAGQGGATATTVQQPHADRAATLAVSPVFVQRAAAPTALTYTATVTNASGDLEPAAGAELTLPAGVTPGTLPAGCTANGQVVTCALGPLVAGSSASVPIPAVAGAGAATTAVATLRATGSGADGTPGNDTDTATLRVNSAPQAVADVAATPTGTSVAVPVRDNDSDPEDQRTDLRISIVTPPGHGTAVVEADQTVTYTPAAGWAGPDSLTYRVDDQHGGTDLGTATVTTANAPPVALDDSINTPPNTPVTLDVLDNDTDPNGDPLTITAVTQPPVTDGAAAIAGNQVAFTPDPVFAGTTTFTYTIDDGSGGTATATVSVDVANAVPTAADDVLAAPYAPGVPVLVPVLANDRDPNNDLLTITAVGPVTPGTVTAAAVAGGIEVTAPAGFSGPATFGYDISDGHGGTSSAQVTVAVGNAGPSAAAYLESIVFGGTLTLDVIADATDPNNDTLRVAGVSAAAHGTAVRNAGGGITYTPDPAWSGTDSFGYTIDDGNGGTATATITVTVANGVAVARADHATAPGGTPIPIDVLANDDDDPNGQPLLVTIDAAPGDGTATVGADRRITYTPDPGFRGTDTFHYRLDDGAGGVTGATVTVTVVNTPPVARPDAAGTDTGTPVTIAVLTGDSDPNGDPIAVAGSVHGGHGRVIPGPGGTLIYTPDAGFYGTDAFVYTIADPGGLTSSAVVTVTVRNAPPDAVDDWIVVRPQVLTTLSLLANDRDANTGQPLRISSVGAAGKGTLTPAADGTTVTYRSHPGQTGADVFAYVLTDDLGATDTATVTIVLDAPPTARDDAASTSWATAVDIPVLANDSDPEGGTLAVHRLDPPGHGTATLNPDGTVRYLPSVAFAGTDSFWYAIRDPAGNTAGAQVFVVVAGTQPMAVPDERSTPYRKAVTIPVLANDVDPTGTLKITSAGRPAHGTVDFTAAAVTYTPPDGFSGPVRFGYTAADTLGRRVGAEVTVTVGAAPTVPDKAVVGKPGAAVGITPPATDNGGRPVTIRKIGKPAHGTAVLNADGTVTYTPDPGFTGTDTFTYEVVDEDGNVAQASIIVTVRPTSPPVTEPPVTEPPVTEPPVTEPPGTEPPVLNRPPVAADDSAGLAEGDTVVLRPLLNDRDPDGDQLTIVRITGSVSAEPDGTIAYVARETGTDTFGYTVSDGRGGTATATVTVHVAAVTELPVTGQDALALIKAGLLAAVAGGVLIWLGGRSSPASSPTSR
ncbi:Ig-like domain-containing protein [Paractinoplanes rishiriensis]|uniref:DUF11 domain-containing protein n=1 Tax=Paractinoplanes rishiriensis TaxID=1050105 RepID=A0A919JZ79_9ACTN|nr:Ig-like domain-containing protein [Actinoplanes rishiriensis]GIE97951.1 hypothetical protein Ari01nite_54160 [Actinoplanes rishiriensis]